MEKRKLCKSGDSSVTVSAAVVTSQKLKNIHHRAFWERLNTRGETCFLFCLTASLSGNEVISQLCFIDILKISLLVSRQSVTEAWLSHFCPSVSPK